ncbi:MAG: hypothetical protein EKK48_10215 [Candidatus Melainabacteria bacterium]|nr:MAG: hypothetical protein EKK48_10215 [Candidatus Melainabacteria bacterium]
MTENLDEREYPERIEREYQELNEREYQERNERLAGYGFFNYFGLENGWKYQRHFGQNSFEKFWHASAEEKASMRRQAGIIEAEKPAQQDLDKMINLGQLNRSVSSGTELGLELQAYRKVFEHETFNREDLREDLYWIEEQRYMKEVDFVNENFERFYPGADRFAFEVDTGTELDFQMLVEERLGYNERPILIDQMKPEAQARYIKEWQVALEKLHLQKEQLQKETGKEFVKEAGKEAVKEAVKEPVKEAVKEHGAAGHEIELNGVLKQLVAMQNLLADKFSAPVLEGYERFLQSVSSEIERRGYKMERFSDLEEYDDFQKHMRESVSIKTINHQDKESSFERIIFGDDHARSGESMELAHEEGDFMVRFQELFPDLEDRGSNLPAGQGLSGEQRAEERREWDERSR